MKLRSGTTYTYASTKNVAKQNHSVIKEDRNILGMPRRSLRISNKNGVFSRVNVKTHYTKSCIGEQEQLPTLMETVESLFTLKDIICCSRAKLCNMNGRICCACYDRRPKRNKYIAFNKSELKDYTFVSRDYYYCPGCKK